MQRALLALALIATGGVSYAQTMQPAVDANGRPIVGRNDWVRQPGDQPGPGNAAISSGMAVRGNANLAAAPAYDGSATINSYPASYPAVSGNAGMAGTSQMGTPLQKGGKLERSHATGPEPMPATQGPHQVAFRDEYGFRYDADGNRLDARGRVISPHIPQQR
jgi:hypothetical protein